jgi:hypothetical protein
MTKTTTKATTAAKQSAPSAPLFVLGYDENQKPRAARFPATDAALVAKAAQLMDLKVYEAATDDLAALAKKLPEGRLYGNGRGFVPNVRQSLYSEIIVTLAIQPQAAVGKDQDELPVATGLPRTWDDIAPGHLVIAQEALEYGWWEAIVIGRNADMFTLRFRDYPKLPKFVRHRNAIALISHPADGPGCQLRSRGRRPPHSPNQIHPIAWPIHRRRQRRRERIRLGITNHNGDDHDDRDQIHPDQPHSRAQRRVAKRFQPGSCGDDDRHCCARRGSVCAHRQDYRSL